MKMTDEYILETYRYFPETGEIQNKKTGNFVRSPVGKGYWGACSKVNGVRSFAYAHHIAFVLMIGRFPARVDHVDGNKSNNRWDNLEEVTTAQNNQNLKKRKRKYDNDLPRGVRRSRGNDKYYARITSNGVSHHLGIFDTVEEASYAYESARLEHHTYYREVVAPVTTGIDPVKMLEELGRL